MLLAATILQVNIARVDTARNVVLALGKELQAPVGISKELGNDLLFVEPHGASPFVILSAVSTALHATILKNEKGYGVWRSKEDISRLHKELAARRVSWLERQLTHIASYRTLHQGVTSSEKKVLIEANNWIKESIQLSSGERNHMDSFSGGEWLPSSALLENLISKIGLNELALTGPRFPTHLEC